MKNITLLAIAALLIGCTNSNAYLKGANSYHLCAALSENETIRNSKVGKNYQSPTHKSNPSLNAEE